MPEFQMYYARQPTFQASGMYGSPLLTIETLAKSHVFVRTVEALDLDGALWNSQGEVWSPNGEAKPLIQSLGLGHTSMSVGDVAQDPQGVYWECTGWDGWRAIEGEDYASTQT